MASHSTRSVLTAVSANAAVTVAKLVGFALSGSGALLSEAIHSVADTSNQALLLLGLRRSERAADAQHPFGYGRARFFWGLVSALGIFFVGAGVTLWHGVDGLMDPQPSTHSWVTWAVLAFAFAVEGYALAVAWASTGAAARAEGVSAWTYAREARDPTVAAVLMEDSAALLGVLLAAAGIGLEQLTGWPGWDALASIAIGLLLAAVAVRLVAANRTYLLGRAVDPAVTARLTAILAAHPLVERIDSLRGTVQTLGHYRVSADVEFDGAPLADKLLARLDLEALAGELQDPARLHAFLRRFADDVIEALGDEIDALEAAIRAELPEALSVDLEAD